MQSAIIMFGVPFKQKPRNGQKEVFKEFFENKPKILSIKLPTGYGKTITALGSYSILRNSGNASRLLMLFPTDAQLNQFKNDGPVDMSTVGIDGNREVIDIRFHGLNSIRKSLRDENHVFATTIQALIQPTTRVIVDELMQKGRWFVVCDEYHHYSNDGAWGKCVLSLSYDHLLAMSATPNRKDNDNAFGEPKINIKYRDAVGENAVKPLRSHSYNYRIDAVLENGDVVSYTTDELVDEAGGEDPGTVEKFRASRKMRWSPKYISPLVSVPLERMMRERLTTGHRLQAIIGCMCVSHAEMVCRQVSEMYPELTVDWVGTGPDGRSDNQQVINRFCPPKDASGRRLLSTGKVGLQPQPLDVLIHVGMAGEGLDSINVSEVIHLNKASVNNSNLQENGRAARYLPGVVGHVNFDSCSEFATKGYVGLNIMDAMDELDPKNLEDEEEIALRENEYRELPDEPVIQLWNISLESIDSGELEFMLKVAKEANVYGIDYAGIEADANHPDMAKIENIYRNMRSREAEKYNTEATLRQIRENVTTGVSEVTGLIVKKISNTGIRIEKSLIRDIKKRINSRKCRDCGEIDNVEMVLRDHYAWIKNLERTIIEKGIPAWLQ